MASIVLALVAFFAISLWRRTPWSVGGVIALIAGLGLALTAAAWFTGGLMGLVFLFAGD